jgi:hypothetical protein
VIDYVLPEPDPAPVTTIAWRVVHIAGNNYVYYDHAFGPATMTFQLDVPGSAQAAADWLRESQGPLTDALAGLDDPALQQTRLTNWGEPWPTYRIFQTLIHEQYHHGAEVSLLRDLYRNRSTLGGVRPG